jgi:uncharacterized protein YdeI (YjbR/CyaY-like superfamily)
VSRSALDRFEQVSAKDRQTWRRWLAGHHATEPGVWLVLWKKASGGPSVSLEEATLEAPCSGWIDSKTQPTDEIVRLAAMNERPFQQGGTRREL